MKTITNLFLILFFPSIILYAQEGYKFTTVKELKATPVKDQYRSGTCWSFSGISFLESELIRMGKGEYDLSEMFIVRKAYSQHADKYVRFHGKINFGAGAEFWDVINVIKEYGLMPENAYPGLVIGEQKHVHGEMDAVLKAMLDAVIENKNKKLSPVWKTGFEALLDAYLGDLPGTFIHNNITYTSKSFLQSLGLNPDDYIMITSFTHHPYYEKFILESPDNWSLGSVYNLPLDEMMEVINHAIAKGYTVGWAADVSENGFSWTNGIAIIPEKEPDELSDLERAKWSEMTKEEKDELVYHFNKPGKEKNITPELRQRAFDNYQTTDDHGMHIIGTAKDQNGTFYYKVKNSWGNIGSKYNGYLYASEAYVRYKTMSVMIHKDALPKAIAKKLGL